jgi:hypothetical protein
MQNFSLFQNFQAKKYPCPCLGMLITNIIISAAFGKKTVSPVTVRGFRFRERYVLFMAPVPQSSLHVYSSSKNKVYHVRMHAAYYSYIDCARSCSPTVFWQRTEKPSSPCPKQDHLLSVFTPTRYTVESQPATPTSGTRYLLVPGGAASYLRLE